MTVIRRWLIRGIVAVILLIPSAAGACPKCFGSTAPKVLQTYYFSALFLSAIPFGIIGSILAWLFIHHKQQIHRNKKEQDHSNGNNAK